MSASRWVSCALLSALSACTLYEKPTFNGGNTRDGSAAVDARTDASADAARDGAVPCTVGRFDCDGDPGNGCETRESVNACGPSCTVCSLPSAIAACTQGACAVAQCLPGFGNCNGMAADGCEVRTRDDRANCGDCGAACTGQQACVNGACVETCPAGQQFCDGACVSTNSLAHCGGCNRPCLPRANSTATCNAGECRYECHVGFGDCSMDDPADGCETQLNTTSNCRGCGLRCVAGQICRETTTGFFECAAAPPSCVGAGLTICGSTCVNTNTSTTNCGGCDNPGGVRFACTSANATGGQCMGGRCVWTACNTGFADCDNATPEGARNGCETAINTTSNCGACGNACTVMNGTAACTGGACARASCNAGFADCDMNRLTCETNVNTSTDHCGACNSPCRVGANARSATCTAGVCRLECNTGFADCNGNPADGCEAELNTEDHCSFCNDDCSRMGSCADGSSRVCERLVRTSPFECLCRTGGGL